MRAAAAATEPALNSFWYRFAASRYCLDHAASDGSGLVLAAVIFHSDFEISGDVALKVFADVGTTFDETLAITIKQTNKIAKPFVRFIL